MIIIGALKKTINHVKDNGSIDGMTERDEIKIRIKI